MKSVKKVLKVVLGFFLVIFLIGGIAWYLIPRRALPDYDKDVQIEGLQNTVTVYRDAYGIPHIYAENEHDLYLATGYVMAQDRLWQMDLLRRVTTGRLSEIFGEDYIETDMLLRALRIPEKSERILGQTDPHILASLHAFTKGVNACIQDMDGKYPLEYLLLGSQPVEWTPEYSANLTGYMAWDLSSAWSAEVVLDKIRNKLGEEKYQSLLPVLSMQKTPVYTPDVEAEIADALSANIVQLNDFIADWGLQVFQGSNNWAVSPEKSTTGAAILSNDMHLGISAPGIWYQIHQVIPGQLNVTGVALPGAPFVVAGHNDNIAWGMTNVMLDDMDFYVEKINPENPNQYEFNGKWKNLKIATETIGLKDGKTVQKEIKYTHRGPLVTDFKKVTDKTVSMRWVGNEFSNEISGVYMLNQAKNWIEFREAAKNFGSVSQNIIYADVAGNIGMQATGTVPIRPGSPLDIYPGHTDEYDWTGFLPFDSLPYSLNPEKGYVSSANNRSTTDDYPHYISAWYDVPYRIERINEMLEAKEKLSVEDFKAMLRDHKSKMPELFVPEFIKLLEKSENLSDKQKKALDYYKQWDFVLTKNSVATTIFEQHYLDFTQHVFEDELGEELYKEFVRKDLLGELVLYQSFKNNTDISWYDNVNTEENETVADLVAQSLKTTVEKLSQKMGNDMSQWEWGKIHTITIAHPLAAVKILDKLFNLNRGPIPVGGSYHTVSPYSYSFGNAFNANHGASHRHIYTPDNWDASLTIIPTGTSGQPASKHYLDQTEAYINNEYHTDYVSLELIKQDALYKMQFLPK